MGILKSDKLSSNRAEQDRFLDRTREAWQRHSPHPLTREDAREITENGVGFFRLLQEWEAKETKKNSS